jgi:hypothetical protein
VSQAPPPAPPNGFEPVGTPSPQPARRRWWPWLILLGLLALVILVGGIALLGRPSASPAPTSTLPPATATPTDAAATPTDAAATSTPSGPQTPGAGIADQIDDVVVQVPGIRQLEPLSDVPYEIISRDRFQETLAELLEEEVDPDQLATEGRLLIRLGLLPDDADLYELLLQLYGSQVAAFYRPDTRAFYVIERDQPFGALDRMIVAHEYTHALQDQHFDLEGSRITDPSEGDAALAQLAVVEGDATLLMFRWAFEHLSFSEQLELLTGLVPTPTDQQLLESMPPILRRQLEFPYNDGFTFVSEVQARGGWAAVDAALAEPPASTEQILHPDRYFGGDMPVAVSLPDLLPMLGAGWQQSYTQTMGELNMQVWLDRGAAEGWGGDRLAMYEDADGQWLIDWHTTWDTEADAAEFEAAVIALTSTLPGHLVVDPDPQRADVRVLLADSVETVDLVLPPR